MEKGFTISIHIPTKEGYVGRACNNSECEQYFKVSEESFHETMYCPYCGDSFTSDELLTSDQIGHVNDVAEQEALEYVQKQLQDMLKKSFGSSLSKKSGITYTPGTIQKKTIHPSYEEREVDSELQCHKCGAKFQVYGVFGFCPGCREENILVYDANIKIIESEISSSSNPERQLRHAYNDLVSTFENICTRKSLLLTEDKGRFQDLFEARKHFKRHATIDILENLSQEQLLTLRRLFQKRHLYVHSDGTVNEQYVKKIPEDSNMQGQKALLSLEELKEAAVALRDVIGDLVKKLEPKG